MSFSSSIQWYRFHADSIWLDGTFKKCSSRNIFLFLICFEPNCGEPSPPRSQGRAPSVLFLLLDRVFPLPLHSTSELNCWGSPSCTNKSFSQIAEMIIYRTIFRKKTIPAKKLFY